MPAAHPTRLSLGRTPRRLSYDRRLNLLLAALLLPSVLLGAALTYAITTSPTASTTVAAVLGLVAAGVSLAAHDTLTRPLQTLANVVAAMREEDFSFRARGARRDDSLGDLALEINALASSLQLQRNSAQDALSLAEQVMHSMQSPILAFTPATTLRLLNPAAEQALNLTKAHALGRTAAELRLAGLLATPDQHLFLPDSSTTASSADSPRWSIRRSSFRLQGVPHTLFLLTDVAVALRQEERRAWQRLLRVLSHEINNSLTPIQSIAGSLRTSNPSAPDLDRGLHVIEASAASLHRFLASYQRLAQLPPPALRPVPLEPLLDRLAALEVRLPVTLHRGPPVTLLADPDQLQQLLINLLANAVEAALLPSEPVRSPTVEVSWLTTATDLLLAIQDSGPGVANPANLFVPFYTTKPTGSGIGLVLAQQIALAHHGSIQLQSTTDPVGCLAKLRLPLTSAAE